MFIMLLLYFFLEENQYLGGFVHKNLKFNKRPALLQGVSKVCGSSVIFSPSRRNQNARTCTGGLSYSEKRSVAMALEDHSHGGHRTVANYFYEGKNENFQGSSKAALPAELCSEVHQVAHSGGNSVFLKNHGSWQSAIKSRRPDRPLASILLYNE